MGTSPFRPILLAAALVLFQAQVECVFAQPRTAESLPTLAANVEAQARTLTAETQLSPSFFAALERFAVDAEHLSVNLREAGVEADLPSIFHGIAEDARDRADELRAADTQAELDTARTNLRVLLDDAILIAPMAAAAAAERTEGAMPSRRADAVFARDIRVALDQAFPIRLSEPAEGVAIGNPNIAGVSVQNDQFLFVTGRAYGSTNLVIVGANGRVLYSGQVVVAPDETAVRVTRGAGTTPLECNPLCRPRMDIADADTDEGADPDDED